MTMPMPRPPLDAAAPSRVDAWIERLYGPQCSLLGPTAADEPRAARPRVLHVTALARRGSDLATVKIGAGSPRSPHDFFALQLARARCDVIVIGGQLLRDEPELDFSLRGPLAPDLRAWRGARRGDASPPRVVVMSRSGAVDPSHPLIAGAWAHAPVLLATGEAAARRVPSHAGLRVLPFETPGLEGVLAWLHRELGSRLVSIEAGPGISSGAHARGLVDELALSVYEGRPLPPAQLGEAPFTRERLARFDWQEGPREIEELSGPWQFSRHGRRP